MSGSEAPPALAEGDSIAQRTSRAGTSFPGFRSGRASRAQADASRTVEDEAAHRAVVARIRASGKETGRKKNERRVPFPGTRLHSRPSPRRLAAALKAVAPPYRRRL